MIQLEITTSETNQFHIIFQNCRKNVAINIWTDTMITYNSNSIIRKMARSKWMIMKLITSDKNCDLFSGHFKQTSLLLFALCCSRLFRQESKNIVYKLFIHSVILFLQKCKQMTLCIYNLNLHLLVSFHIWFLVFHFNIQ